MSEELKAVTAIAEKYFDALYFGNTELFAEYFYPDAMLSSSPRSVYVRSTDQ